MVALRFVLKIVLEYKTEELVTPGLASIAYLVIPCGFLCLLPIEYSWKPGIKNKLLANQCRHLQYF